MVNESFATPIKYFLNDLIDEPSFFQESKTVKNFDFYRELLKTAVIKHFANPVELDLLMLMEIPDCQFVHGSAILSNARMLMFYFFLDVKTGMATVSSLGNKSDIFRLTVFESKNSKLAETAIIPATFSKTYN